MAPVAPNFSLVIPTLRRADTLRHALTTLICQDYDDFEIVVQNNGRDRQVEEVVKEFGDPKIRHFSTDSVLTITENWETALANARGEFVTVVGDDDGLFPDACKLAARVIDQTPLEIVSWSPFCYYWPRYLNPDLAKRLVARVNDDFYVETTCADHQIRQFYRFAIDYSRLPMIYNSFVRRSVLDRAIQANGRYLFGLSPDVMSGIVNACHVERYGRLSQPLSMTGLSHHSTGHNLFASSERLGSSDRYRRDFTPSASEPRLVETDHLQEFIARDMLLAHDRMLANRGVRIHFPGLIESLAASINDRPGFYESTLNAIHALADIHQVDLSTIAIPPKVDKVPPWECGVYADGPRSRVFVVDGAEAGLNDVAGAIRYATRRFGRPSAEHPVDVRTPRSGIPLVTEDGDLVEFCPGANGLPALHSGWSEAEDWGTWSVGKTARLTLRTRPERDHPLLLQLKLRPFVHPLHPEMNVVCRSRGREIAEWRCDLQSPHGTHLLYVPSGDIDSGGRFELELLILNPCAPSELGLSADKRLLGIGIESLFARAVTLAAG